MTVDPEMIAKVLDGRATPEERARLLAQADESPELLAILADSAAAMDDEAASSTGVIPIDSRSARRFPRAAWVAIAAVMAFAIAIPTMRQLSPDLPGLPIATMASARTAVPIARGGPSLPGVRGASDASRPAQSVLIGARVMDYVVLATHGDTAAATVAIEIAAALRAIPGGSAAAAQLDAFSSSPNARSLTPAVIEAIEQVVDRKVFRAAGWVELTRIAATDRMEPVLGWVDLRSALRAMASDRSSAAEVRALAERIRASIAATPRDWTAIEDLSTQLLAELGRPAE